MVCANLRFLFWGLLRASDRIEVFEDDTASSHEQSRYDGTTALITSLLVIPCFVVGFILTASLSNANRLSCYLEFLSSIIVQVQRQDAATSKEKPWWSTQNCVVRLSM
jgi:hypothetical protein